MPDKRLFWLAVPALLLLAVWWWQSGSDDVEQTAGAGSGPTEQMDPVGLAGEEHGTDRLEPGADEADVDQDEKLPFDTPMKAQLAQIAEAYRQQSRFPNYSKPLSVNDWQQLNPRGYVAHERPVEGAPGLTMAVRTDYFINDISEPLKVWVQTTADDVKAQSASVVIRSQAGAASGSVALPMVKDEGPFRVFEGMVPAAHLAAAGAGEVAMVADVKLTDGSTVRGAGVIELYEAIATLNYLGDAYVDGADLVIPAHFDVRQQGYYRVQANLYDAQTLNPVSHVNAAFVLSEQDNTGLLKVHAVTLRDKNAPGPYVLKDFNIMRSPARPGDLTRFGSAVKSEYTVRGFSLDSYSDEPYVDPQAQQSQEFLDRISGGSGSQ